MNPKIQDEALAASCVCRFVVWSPPRGCVSMTVVATGDGLVASTGNGVVDVSMGAAVVTETGGGT